VRWRNCSCSSSRLNVEDSSCNCLGSCCNLCLVDSCCILGIHQVSQTGAVAHTVVVVLLRLLRLLHRLLVPGIPEPFAPSCNSCCRPNLSPTLCLLVQDYYYYYLLVGKQPNNTNYYYFYDHLVCKQPNNTNYYYHLVCKQPNKTD
jgi:hypothetical protein